MTRYESCGSQLQHRKRSDTIGLDCKDRNAESEPSFFISFMHPSTSDLDAENEAAGRLLGMKKEFPGETITHHLACPIFPHACHTCKVCPSYAPQDTSCHSLTMMMTTSTGDQSAAAKQRPRPHTVEQLENHPRACP